VHRFLQIVYHSLIFHLYAVLKITHVHVLRILFSYRIVISLYTHSNNDKVDSVI